MSVRLSSALLTSSLFALPALAAAQQPLTFERSLPVSTPATLDVSTGAGDITVRAGSTAAIVVKGTVKVNTGWSVPGNAADLARQLVSAPPIVHEGNTVRVGRIVDETMRKAVSVSYDITVPAATAVAANSGSGSVSVSGVEEAVKANTGSGDIVVTSIDGDVKLQTGSGNLQVKDVRRAASLSTGSGSVDATLTGKGDVRVSTGSGDIRLGGVIGLVTASTGSGDVAVDGSPTGEWKLSAASGNVRVTVPSSHGFTLDARTSSGSVDVDAPLTAQGKMDRRHVQGTVRGGGPTLRLSTASGSIAVK
ncbi:MAG: DUF4097 family beta strand repeat protein [Acidobacteria bacterium]|nr:DUF4097 family beta strand repeat protein [Acidobacteriota bacterium]